MANKAKLVLELEIDSRDHAEKISQALADREYEYLATLLTVFNPKFVSGRINS